MINVFNVNNISYFNVKGYDNMYILPILSINIFSLLVLSTIFLYERRDGLKKFYQDKIFMIILYLTIIMIILDSVGWFLDGRVGTFNRVIYYIVTVVNFILNPVLPLNWVTYVDFQIFNNERRIKKLRKIFSIPILINAAAVILSPVFGTVFYIDSLNVYHRGSFYIIMTIVNYIMILYSIIIVLFNKNKIEVGKFNSLVVFPLPTLISTIIQNKFCGISIIWAGFTLSIIIVYISIQNRRLNTDYLTDLYNRRQLDTYLKEKIENSESSSKFAAIMIDVDDFKTINDKFGHQVGDEALIYTAEILKKSFSKKDFISRYAGDEFVIILNIKNRTNLKDKVEKLNKNLHENNLKSNRAYKISLSMGYAVYNYTSKMSADKFMKLIDSRMYESKKLKKI